MFCRCWVWHDGCSASRSNGQKVDCEHPIASHPLMPSPRERGLRYIPLHLSISHSLYNSTTVLNLFPPNPLHRISAPSGTGHPRPTPSCAVPPVNGQDFLAVYELQAQQLRPPSIPPYSCANPPTRYSIATPCVAIPEGEQSDRLPPRDGGRGTKLGSPLPFPFEPPSQCSLAYCHSGRQLRSGNSLSQ